MTLRTFLQSGLIVDRKTEQFSEYVRNYPVIGDLNIWIWFRAALSATGCPACLGRDIQPVREYPDGTGLEICNYCSGTGKVELHLVTHPMNVHALAKQLEGKRYPIEIETYENLIRL